jgi:hypothetical protein
MTTLNSILEKTCGVLEIEKSIIQSKKRKNELYQVGRIIYSQIASSGKFGYFSKGAIGETINRSASNISYYIMKSPKKYRGYDITLSEIIKSLENENNR